MLRTIFAQPTGRPKMHTSKCTSRNAVLDSFRRLPFRRLGVYTSQKADEEAVLAHEVQEQHGGDGDGDVDRWFAADGDGSASSHCESDGGVADLDQEEDEPDDGQQLLEDVDERLEETGADGDGPAEPPTPLPGPAASSSDGPVPPPVPPFLGPPPVGAAPALRGERPGSVASASRHGGRPCRVHLLVPGGKISYYDNANNIEAVCNNHAHGRCVLTRRMGQAKRVRGRPLGLAVAWLAKGCHAADKPAHWRVGDGWPTDEERVAARAFLHAMDTDAARELLALEALRDDDERSEPEVDHPPRMED